MEITAKQRNDEVFIAQRSYTTHILTHGSTSDADPKMCSVPGVPTPGSEVSVVITRVNLNQNCGLVELWVNLNNEIKHVYEEMREEIQTPKRNFCGPEGKTGDLCLVSIEEKWHRARIVSVQEEKYNVFLIDQGQLHGTRSDTLAWGKDECFILPPEIECCVLANVLSIENNWPERATNFLKSLPGKEFRGTVQHALMPDRKILLDLTIISKHLCKEGVAKKVPAVEFKNLVLKCSNLPEENKMDMITKEQSLNVCSQLESNDQYFYPEVTTNSLESIRVTEVIDPSNIFCELGLFSKAMKILTEQLNQELNDKASTDKSQPQTVGAPCAAMGMDGKWRRALLKSQVASEDTTVEVFFVDEGKTELVQASNVKNLDRKFLRMPVITYKCKMEGAKNDRQWEHKEIDHLKSIILDQNIVARFQSHNLPEDKYNVILYTSSAACINDYFFETKVDEFKNDANFPHKLFINCDAATPSNSQNSSLIQGYNSPFSPMERPLCDSLTVGASVNVRISCIDGPNKFWCQTSQCDKKLDVLMKDLQCYYASVHPKPLVESFCVAKNPDDNKWYRAKIITGQQSPDVEVRFIDFGETKKVPLRELRPIDPTFLRLDAQAFQCSLVNVPPTDLDHANKEFHKFVDESSDLKCVIKAVTSDEEGMLLNVVDLQTQSESASQVLTEKLATIPAVFNRSDYKIEVASKEKICISYSETVHNFYCQLDRNSQLFQQVQRDLKKLASNAVHAEHSFAVNDICIAKYSDAKWQRGQVVEISPDLKVHFVDLGKTLAVNKSDIQPFPNEASSARTVPILAVPLALFNVPEDIPEEINAWFAEKVVGKSLAMSVLGKEENGKLLIELFEDLRSLNAQVREKIVNFRSTSANALNDSTTKKTDAMEVDGPKNTHNASEVFATKIIDYRKPVVSFETQQVLKATSISSPDYFWLECGDTSELDKIMELAQIEGQLPQPPKFWESVTYRFAVLALYKDDNKWYRAKVLKDKRDSDGISVVFVDYGNEEKVKLEEVRPISKKLLEFPPQAFLCTLELDVEQDDEEEWSGELCDKFYDLVLKQPVSVKVLKMGRNWDVHMPQYTVHIDNEQVYELLQSSGIKYGENAITNPPDEPFKPFRHYGYKNILYNKLYEISEMAQKEEEEEEPEEEDDDYDEDDEDEYNEDEHYRKFISKICPDCPCLAYDHEDKKWHRAHIVWVACNDIKVVLVDTGKHFSVRPCNASDTAQFVEDNQWYRALVGEKSGDKYNVVFVDYGNEIDDVTIKEQESCRKIFSINLRKRFCAHCMDLKVARHLGRQSFDDFYSTILDKRLK
ncbi:hypothetical protein WMY93_016838 [Mugilogobius chulae]|uniref:Tudor domain-containing protein n=1 Tax=Mugilogobius chulae TaxID=88201 RepID=A0AAW0NLX0_9GOBI